MNLRTTIINLLTQREGEDHDYPIVTAADVRNAFAGKAEVPSRTMAIKALRRMDCEAVSEHLAVRKVVRARNCVPGENRGGNLIGWQLVRAK